MKPIYHVRHKEGNGGDCGVCALAMVLDIPYEDVERAVGYAVPGGVSLPRISKYLQSLGYTMRRVSKLGTGVRGVMVINMRDRYNKIAAHAVAVDEVGVAFDSNCIFAYEWDDPYSVYPSYRVKIKRRYEVYRVR